MEIDRAIEILNPDHREHYKNLEEVNEACRMGMEALERTRWIPATQPPKKAGVYQVTVTHWLDGKPVVRDAYWNGADWLARVRRHELTPRVICWMPLPEPGCALPDANGFCSCDQRKGQSDTIGKSEVVF